MGKIIIFASKIGYMRIEDEIKSSFNDDYHKAVVNLVYTHHTLMERMNESFKTKNLTHQQFNVLRILKGQFPKPVSIGLIKERMLDKMSDTSRIIERLLKKELVIKKTSKQDRRSTDILISEKGINILKEINPVINEFNKNLAKKLNISEVQVFNELLDKIR